MINKIPKNLFRGDSDPKKIRHLKETIHFDQLHTNLIKGGYGRIIDEKPLIDLIDKHVDLGWGTTHFLSFSEFETTAFKFGIGHNPEDVVERIQEYSEYLDSGKDWDFAIIRLNTDSMNLRQLSNGVYVGNYPPTLTEFKKYNSYRVILINVSEYLEPFEGYEQSKENSHRDKEWLVLPATPKDFNGIVEYSAILDCGSSSEIRRFKKD